MYYKIQLLEWHYYKKKLNNFNNHLMILFNILIINFNFILMKNYRDIILIHNF